MSEKMQALESRIADQEAHQQLLQDVAPALFDEAKPAKGHFAALALRERFTARDLEGMHEVFGWAVKQHTREIEVTRDDFAGAFAARLPHLAGKLEAIMGAYRADGNFGRLCRLVLDQAQSR